MWNRGWLLPSLGAALTLLACGDEPVRVPPPPAGAGGMKVSWVLLNPGGTEISCTEAGFSSFTVRIGGEPVRTTCGEPQSFEASGLVPGRYPLVIAPEVFVGTTAADYVYRANIQVEDQKVTEHTAQITVDPSQLNVGTLAIRWRIDGRMPNLACGNLGAETFRLTADDTSIEPFSVDLPCAQGTTTLEMKTKGSYSLTGSLRDSAGRVVKNQIRSAVVAVLEGQTTQANFEFTESATVSGSVEARWTITSSAAAEGCPAVGGETVEFTVLKGDVGNPIAVATGTTACAQGVLRLDRVPVGEGLRARLDLLNGFGVIIADAFRMDLRVEDTRTTTIAVDFTP